MFWAVKVHDRPAFRLVCRFFVVRALRRLSECLMLVVAGTKTEGEAEEKQ